MIARTSGRRPNTRHLHVPPADIKASRCGADSQHRVGADAPQRRDGGNHPLWRAARRHGLDHLEMIDRACRTILALIFANLSRRVVSAHSLAPSGSDMVWMKLARLSATRAMAAKRHWRRSVGRTTGSRRRHSCNSRRNALPRSMVGKRHHLLDQASYVRSACARNSSNRYCCDAGMLGLTKMT